MEKSCDHIKEVNVNIEPNTPEGCEECLKSGDKWVSLRKCLSCGHVGCCDSSKNKHATKHFHQTNHPIIQIYKEKPVWNWCYIDEVSVEFD